MRHILVAALITILVTLGLQALFDVIELMPPVATEEGALIDSMFNLQQWIISFLFSLVVVFMLYSVVVFRRRPGEEAVYGSYFTGNTGLEVAWTLVPLVVVIAVSTLGAQYLARIIDPHEDELLVQVTGFQFGWRFDYPDGEISSNALNLPVGRKVHLELNSLDVIHSFWVPEFRVKQDAVPGKVTHLRFTPTETGTFKLRCAELCGLAHSFMLADVNVMQEAAFEEWMAGQAVPDEQVLAPAELGAQVYETNCSACHSVDGSEKVGPTFLNAFGSQRELASGEMVLMDEAYVRDSIVNPGAQLVVDYTNVMPAGYGDLLTAGEIDGLVAYIKSLSGE